MVFKQESEYYEHFYNELTPWIHYIPINRNLSNLVELIKVMINDEETAKTISLNGQKYARENLAPHNILGYYLLLFQVRLININFLGMNLYSICFYLFWLMVHICFRNIANY